MNGHTWECGRCGREISFRFASCCVCKRKTAMNGSRIPDPCVDNAEPVNCRTWTTYGDRLVMVVVKPMGKGVKTRLGHLQLFLAQLEVDGPCAYGNGPGEAIARLDEVMSKGH